jgi:nicotinic acid mononucleotide adenylyltransferase
MNKKELIKKVAEKIYHITGKDDSRTAQNWIDAEEIVNMILEHCKKEEKIEEKPKKGRKTKKSEK